MKPRRAELVVVVLVAAAAGTLPSATARAHGGLPISSAILFQGDRLLVPTQYWGAFFGVDGGPWRWICEEAINGDQKRAWAIGGDGTLYVTDGTGATGVTASRDGGCTWVGAGGELATRSTSSVVADPVDPKRAWATTDSGLEAPWNALFTTVDRGLTWTRVVQSAEAYVGVALSANGQTVWLASRARDGTLAPHLRVSTNRGLAFAEVPLALDFHGGPPREIRPLAVAPGDGKTLYLQVATDPYRGLLRVEMGGAPATLLADLQPVAVPNKGSAPAEIGGIAFDTARGGAILLATLGGVLRSSGGGPFGKVSALSQAQCLAPHGGALYACTWNYAPDEAAVSRSDDGGDHFHRVFQYADTRGPTTECAPTTPVGMICPGVWAKYAVQLGIDDAPDGGAGRDAATAPPPATPAGCACATGTRGGREGTSTGAAVALAGAALAMVALLQRSNRPRRPRT